VSGIRARPFAQGRLHERVELIHDNPLWKTKVVPVSGVLITYNQEAYVSQALASVLHQDYPMDLIISDDTSTDCTRDLIRRIVDRNPGHHRIRLRLGSRNLGVCGNQNASIDFAEGELIVLFEGDDVSVPERVRKLVEAYVVRRRAVAGLGSAVLQMDSRGHTGARPALSGQIGDAWTLFFGCWAVPGCGLAFRRDCFFEIGPINKRLLSGDIALWMRAVYMKQGGVLQLADPLVHYRMHGANESRKFLLEFGSPKILQACCVNLLKNEVAQMLELRKIARYRKRIGLRDEFDAAWTAHYSIARARAAFVFAIGRKSRIAWIGPALLAAKFPPLRGISLRAISLAIFPWSQVIYKWVKPLFSQATGFTRRRVRFIRNHENGV
jgi:hypothetical protein